MKKYEFLAALQRELADMNAAEVVETCAFYEELLNDMIESGTDEEAAVARLGDPRELAQKVLGYEPAPKTEPPKSDQQAPQPDPQPQQSQNWGSILKDLFEGLAANARENLGGGHIRFDFSRVSTQRFETLIDPAEVRAIEVDWPRGEAEIRMDVAQSQIRLTEKRAESDPALTWSVRGGVLSIRYGDGAHIFSKDLELLLPPALGDQLTRIRFNGVSAELTMSDLRSEELQIHTVSGDVEATRIHADSVRIEGTSSDLELDADARQLLLKTFSGDIDLSFDAAERVEVSTVSGDASVEGHAEALTIHSTSGDLSFEGAAQRIDVSTISGEEDLTLSACPQSLQASATSGDIQIELPVGSACQLRFQTVSGTLEVDDIRTAEPGAPTFTIRTVSGDVSLHD